MDQISKEMGELKLYVLFSCENKQGIKNLKEVIRRESKKLNKELVNVGIIGYPNTGKSSIINLFAGRFAARTSPESGYTKGLQKIKFSSGLYLIDTPGIIPLNENAVINRAHLIKHSEIGVRTWDKAGDLELVIYNLMKDYPRIIEKHYGINANGNSEVLIEKLGRHLGYLKKEIL